MKPLEAEKRDGAIGATRHPGGVVLDRNDAPVKGTFLTRFVRISFECVWRGKFVDLMEAMTGKIDDNPRHVAVKSTGWGGSAGYHLFPRFRLLVPLSCRFAVRAPR